VTRRASPPDLPTAEGQNGLDNTPFGRRMLLMVELRTLSPNSNLHPGERREASPDPTIEVREESWDRLGNEIVAPRFDGMRLGR
jgi:hypothetical protein